MISESQSRLVRRLGMISTGAAIGVFGIGFLVLLGWIFNVAFLKSLHPNLVTMKANTAIAFMLTGISLWCLQTNRVNNRFMRYIAWGGASVVAALGLLSLTEYALDWNAGIDQLIFTEPSGAVQTIQPGRMAPNTALNFLLIGLAALLLDVRTRNGRRPAQYLIALEGIIALAAMGRLYFWRFEAIHAQYGGNRHVAARGHCRCIRIYRTLARSARAGDVDFLDG